MTSVINIAVKVTTPISTGPLAMKEFNRRGYQTVIFHSGTGLIGISIEGVSISSYYDRKKKRAYGGFNEILMVAMESNPQIKKELGL